jgi:hypothetical protein
MKVTRKSPLTDVETTLDIDITQDQMDYWESGALIQDAMPNLTPDEREFLISGMTKDDWNNLFGTEVEA